MRKTLFISIVLLCLLNVVVTQAQQTKAAKEAEYERLKVTPQGTAVDQYNKREVAWLKDPGSDELGKQAKEAVVPGSQAEGAVLERIETYKSRGVHLTPESRHDTTVISVEVSGDTATVKTLENPNWVSTSGRTYIRTAVPHTYTLKKVGDNWKVSVDDFEL